MLHLVTEISRVTFIVIFAVFTYDCFNALKKNTTEDKARALYSRQTAMIYLFLVNGNLLLYFNTLDPKIFVLALAEIVFVTIAMIIYRKIYESASPAVVNNMCMLLSIGFIMLTRLDQSKAIRQLFFACIALILTCVIPLFLSNVRLIQGLKLFYIVAGILLLAVVAVAGKTTYGAKINIRIGSVAIQPSEFVKILMVLFIACMLVKDVSRKQVFKTVVLCGLMILILAYSRDLGNAMIFYLTLLLMVYAATQKPGYLVGGAGLFVLAAFVGYFAFSHVRTRVIAWKDPLSVVDSAGYQISQSLFAIGSGGWFGTGLYQGMPKRIPVVETDFIFSAISEELGGLFALCLIFICIANFLMFFNIALKINNRFYKLMALGLGVLYASQVFTTLGGVTKFIPSTGVTLPLISYGGSSLMATMLMFAMVEGLYQYRGDKEEADETAEFDEKQRYKRRKRQRR